MILYIAGPMTGRPDLNYPLFFFMEDLLKAAGYTVLNPARNNPDDTSWLGFMRVSLAQIAQCDGIATLPGWGDSRGAALEVHIARSLDLPVQSTETWLKMDQPKPDPQPEAETAEHKHLWEKVDNWSNTRKCGIQGCDEVGWYIPAKEAK